MTRDTAIQFDREGRLRHLLTLRGLERDRIEPLLDASSRAVESGRGILANLFFEPSTRTRCSFEIAAGRLGWRVVNVAESSSSTVKGETVAETTRTLAAMGVGAVAIRHSDPDASWAAAEAAPAGVSVINAGGGSEDHPTQGLLDAYTIRESKGDIASLRIALCGDVRHSRVARSDIQAFSAMGARGIRLVGPPELLPGTIPEHCEAVHDLDDGIRDADVVVVLRIQKERMAAAAIPDAASYHSDWGLTEERLSLARPDCIVMHPGPANPGVEITNEVLRGPRSVVLDQVRNGVGVRARLLARLAGRDSGG